MADNKIKTLRLYTLSEVIHIRELEHYISVLNVLHVQTHNTGFTRVRWLWTVHCKERVINKKVFMKQLIHKMLQLAMVLVSLHSRGHLAVLSKQLRLNCCSCCQLQNHVSLLKTFTSFSHTNKNGYSSKEQYIVRMMGLRESYIVGGVTRTETLNKFTLQQFRMG